jgi:uncharacterized RDD family membrane protein YckC
MFRWRYADPARATGVADHAGAKVIVAAMGKVSGSWLDGPGVAADGVHGSTYAGERLGLPASGPGAVAGFGRRLGAIFVDWIICLLIAGMISGRSLSDAHHPLDSLVPPLVLLVEYLLLVGTIGSTIGMRLFGIGVRRVGGSRLAFGWVAVRTLLLLLAVPPLVYDRDQRGLHDKASGSVAVRL